MVYVVVSGAEELMKFLKELCSEKKVDQVAKILAERTAQLAFRYAPEDTGKMENDIRVQKNGNGEYEVICDVRWCVFNEFGTYMMPVGTEENPLGITSTSGKASYRPFMRPAAYDILSQLNEIINGVFFGKMVSG